MPVRTVQIYEVPNSYVDTGTAPTVSATFSMTINDDDGNLEATEALDPGTSQQISGSFGTADSYTFRFDDVVNIGGSVETIKTFQLVIGGVTRSFVMNDTGGSIPGLNVGDNFSLVSFGGYTPISYGSIPCFCAGTLIDTYQGQVAVDALRVGDLVRTLDHGFQPIQWIGGVKVSLRTLLADPSLNPVVIPANAFGQNLPAQRLSVSPQHRILLKGASLELIAAQTEGFAAAKHLIGFNGITQPAAENGTEYYHVMFSQHEVITANNLSTESFYIGDMMLNAMPDDMHQEVQKLFPELLSGMSASAPRIARQVLKPHEISAFRQLSAG